MSFYATDELFNELPFINVTGVIVHFWSSPFYLSITACANEAFRLHPIRRGIHGHVEIPSNFPSSWAREKLQRRPTPSYNYFLRVEDLVRSPNVANINSDILFNSPQIRSPMRFQSRRNFKIPPSVALDYSPLNIITPMWRRGAHFRSVTRDLRHKLPLHRNKYL